MLIFSVTDMSYSYYDKSQAEGPPGHSELAR